MFMDELIRLDHQRQQRRNLPNHKVQSMRDALADLFNDDDIEDSVVWCQVDHSRTPMRRTKKRSYSRSHVNVTSNHSYDNPEVPQ